MKVVSGTTTYTEREREGEKRLVIKNGVIIPWVLDHQKRSVLKKKRFSSQQGNLQQLYVSLFLCFQPIHSQIRRHICYYYNHYPRYIYCEIKRRKVKALIWLNSRAKSLPHKLLGVERIPVASPVRTTWIERFTCLFIATICSICTWARQSSAI